MNRVICWFSYGVTSAVATKLALDMFKHSFFTVEIVCCDTNNEHPDSYRFLADCEKIFGQEIKRIKSTLYDNIQEVWIKYNSLNSNTGAICSSEMKRDVRRKYQQPLIDVAHVFGFDASERIRHENMRRNNPEINAISPCYSLGYSKEECIRIIEQEWKIRVPQPYYDGQNNNNCDLTGCVQGGAGYWQKRQREKPEGFAKMAHLEHVLTNTKKLKQEAKESELLAKYLKELGVEGTYNWDGEELRYILESEPITINRETLCKEIEHFPTKKAEAVTCLRATRKINGKKEKFPVFLLKHPDYPYDLSMIKGKEPKPLMECHGFCNTSNKAEELDELDNIPKSESL